MRPPGRVATCSPRPRIAGAGTLALAATVSTILWGCRTSETIDRSDWGAVPEYETIHVTTLDGVRTAVGSPVAYTDHVRGIRLDRNGDRGPGSGVDSVRIPLDSIELVEVRDFSLGRTLLIGAVAGTAVGIIAAKGKSDVRPTPQPSSCPFVYSFDGTSFRLDSETFAGAVTRGLERTDLDNLDHLTAAEGTFRLLLTNERPEVQYTDMLRLLVVDHPQGTRIVPDREQRPRALGRIASPLSATGFDGADVLAAVEGRDERMWTGKPLSPALLHDGRFATSAPERSEGTIGGAPDLPTADALQLRDGFESTFPRVGERGLLLVEARNTGLAPFALETFLALQGDSLAHWYRAVNRGTELRDRLRRWFVREGMLHVSIRVGDDWVLQDVLPDVGPNVLKAQVARLDLSAVTEDVVRIRLESARGLWVIDRVALGEEAEPDLELLELEPRSAIDRLGRERAQLLALEDARYHTAFPGDTVRLTYQAPPPPARGRTRSLLVRSRGFYHLATDHTGRPTDAATADRILDEPRFGNRYILERWLARPDR